MNRKSEIRQRKFGEHKEIKSKKDVGTAAEKPGKKNRRKISATNGTKPAFHRVWTRTVVIFCLMVVVYFFTMKGKEKRFATAQERNLIRFQNLTCSPAYLQDINSFSKCVPAFCGRFVNDKLLHPREIEVLLDVAKSCFSLTRSPAGPTILDLHSGALSQGKGFIDVYNISHASKIFRDEHLLVYKTVKSKIQKAIAEQFLIDPESLYLTYPSFISRITNSTLKTINDEYWQPHADQDAYEAYHYTSLVYLADYGKDFMGGRFVFVDNKVNMTIEPTQGRVVSFTSGSENMHYLEQVTTGVRYALTISFTCNPKFTTSDPKLKPRDEKNMIVRIVLDPKRGKNSNT